MRLDERQAAEEAAPAGLWRGGRSEAPTASCEGSETITAKRMSESTARNNERLMEEVCSRENCLRALQRVKSNKGSAGIDGMTLGALASHPRTTVERDLQAATGATGSDSQTGRRGAAAGHPTVLDRMVQQAVLQVLQSRWDAEFSEHSHGFRPGRSAHQAVAKAQQYVAEGRRWVVDLDLEKFFDRVNHDKLMAAVARRVADKRMLGLIRAFLTAGVMENGLVGPVDEGTPQGGPLSPLLSNLVLDELDRELERRKHCFVRYADDCNIYVRSRTAGERVKRSITRFITRKLKLKVNEQKSAVARPVERKFLGFSLTHAQSPKRRIAAKAVQRFKQKVRELTSRTRGISIERMAKELASYLQGWKSYFGFAQTPWVFEELDRWIRRRLRSTIWKQWKRGRVRCGKLLARGVRTDLAASTAGSAHGPWRVANSPALAQALPIAYFNSLGIPRMFVRP